jgi:predicted phosphoribosyltransferase
MALAVAALGAIQGTGVMAVAKTRTEALALAAPVVGAMAMTGMGAVVAELVLAYLAKEQTVQGA